MKTEPEILQWSFIDPLRSNREFALKAAKINGRAAAYYLHPCFRLDEEFVLIVAKTFPDILSSDWTGSSFNSNRDFALRAVKMNGLCPEHLDPSFRLDPEIVLEAVRSNGLALQFAAEPYLSDGLYISEAIKQNVLAIDYVQVVPTHENLENWRIFILENEAGRETGILPRSEREMRAWYRGFWKSEMKILNSRGF